MPTGFGHRADGCLNICSRFLETSEIVRSQQHFRSLVHGFYIKYIQALEGILAHEWVFSAMQKICIFAICSVKPGMELRMGLGYLQNHY